MIALLLLAITTFVSPQGSIRRVPPPLEAANCSAAPADQELPSERFERKGGRTSRSKIFRREGFLTVDNVQQGRDLGRYDIMELRNPEPHRKSNVPILIRARRFLWEHWQTKQRGYLKISLSSVDATSTSHIFIEPDDSGTWRVSWRIVRDDGDINDLPTYYSVYWVKSAGWKKAGTPIPQGQTHDTATHILEFRDNCDEVEQSF